MESEGDKGAHELVTSLAWIADGVDELEDDPVEVLMEMGRYEPELAIHYIGMQWFSDGLTEDEAGAFLGITYIDYFVADETNQISELAWVSDGITLDEAWAVHGVGGIAFEDENAANAVISEAWFRDGISSEEADVLLALGLLADKTGAAVQFLSMPFLETIEETDALALFSLYQLALETWHNLATMPSEFHLFLQHPTISDGITDEETVLVTLASSAYAGNPGLIDSLLDPARVMLESRVVQLPVAGAVELMIARTEPGPHEVWTSWKQLCDLQRCIWVSRFL